MKANTCGLCGREVDRVPLCDECIVQLSHSETGIDKILSIVDDFFYGSGDDEDEDDCNRNKLAIYVSFTVKRRTYYLIFE